MVIIKKILEQCILETPGYATFENSPKRHTAGDFVELSTFAKGVHGIESVNQIIPLIISCVEILANLHVL